MDMATGGKFDVKSNMKVDANGVAAKPSAPASAVKVTDGKTAASTTKLDATGKPVSSGLKGGLQPVAFQTSAAIGPDGNVLSGSERVTVVFGKPGAGGASGRPMGR